MLDTLSGLLLELGFLTGIILLCMSFMNRYRKNRTKLMIVGIVLIVLGLIFFDYSAAVDAFERGREAGSGM